MKDEQSGRWSAEKPAPEEFVAECLRAFPDLGTEKPVLPQLLWNRGITGIGAIGSFLHPDYDLHTYDPFLLTDMSRAVSRIRLGLERGEEIVVFSDYDADGVCGAAILSEFLTVAGGRITVLIPDRLKESYGLSRHHIAECKERNISLVITVDCGVTDHDEIHYARSVGIDVIVVDHHVVSSRPVDAYAVVDHQQADETYPERILSGAGLAYKLVQALIADGAGREQSYRPGREKWSLDLVAIAAIADVVPLVGENRAFAWYGLKVMRAMRRLGLAAMLYQLGVLAGDVDEETVGFVIAPRLNAASRMAHADLAFGLLTATDAATAGHLAALLEGHNTSRKVTVERIMQELDLRLQETPIPSLVFEGALHWSPGVLGIAASRLVDRFARPVFLYGVTTSGLAKGSVRSPEGVHAVELMREVKELFIDFGGHERSGGFSFHPDRAPALALRLHDALARMEAPRLNQEGPHADAELNLADVHSGMYEVVRRLAPFGNGNPVPRFLIRRARISNIRAVGNDGAHLKLRFEGDTQGIYFRAPVVNFHAGDIVDVVGELQKNTWNGSTRVELRVVDMRHAT